MMISFAIPNYNRVESVIRLIDTHSADERISEIVICDDHSRPEINGDIERHSKDNPKVRLITNEVNLGAYGNKARTVKNCKFEWVVLCDSDNFINKDYIDVLFAEKPWQEDVMYCPEKAGPHDFREFSNVIIPDMKTMWEVNQLICKSGGRDGAVLLNTGNYFFNRDRYIETSERGMDYCKDKACFDVIAFNYFWIRSKNKMKCVEGLQYDHASSADSIYVNEYARDASATDKKLQTIDDWIVKTIQDPNINLELPI